MNARGRRTVATIEAAALDAAEAAGSANVTVRDICDRAGVSERVFFNHFPTREDAFLGHDHPAVDEEWAARYIADGSVSLTSGASRLVLLPSVPADVQERRHRLIGQDPALLARTYARLLPVRERCRDIVIAAAETRHPSLSPEHREQLARIVVSIAAEMLAIPDAADRVTVLSALQADLHAASQPVRLEDLDDHPVG